jgi:integrase
VEDKDRHGNIRIYFRSKGYPKVRLRNVPWTTAFMAEYDAAKAQIRTAMPGLSVGTWRWLVAKYVHECADYQRLDKRTKKVRRSILEATCQELIAPNSVKKFADFPLSRMGTDAIEVLRDRKLSTPEAANSRVKAIRQVFKFAIRKKIVAANPAREVEYLKSGSQGFHTWTIDEVRKYETRHGIGTKARLALALLLLTGQRRSDVIRLGSPHVRNGRLTFTQFKGRNRKPKTLTLPMLPTLKKIIDASRCGEFTYLVTDLGRPFSDAGFGNKFRDWCDQAGLPHCSAHGLRKAGATIAANNGATSRQLMSIFGWDTLKEAERYTRSADQARLADDSMHLLEIETSGRKRSRKR